MAVQLALESGRAIRRKKRAQREHVLSKMGLLSQQMRGLTE